MKDNRFHMRVSEQTRARIEQLCDVLALDRTAVVTLAISEMWHDLCGEGSLTSSSEAPAGEKEPNHEENSTERH